VDEWNAWRRRSREEVVALGGRLDRRSSQEEEEEKEEIEVWIEELIEEVEELVVD
jgi:translation initiation factor 3 subunit B